VFIIFTTVLIVIAVWVFTRVYLRGESLARYDTAPGSEEPLRSEPSKEHFEVLELLSEFSDKLATSKSAKERLAAMRVNMDAMGDKMYRPDVSIVPADIDGIPGEWVLAEGADSDRRLLYLHGGAFTMGSPRSHRIITSKLSSISGSAVLAVDYRLMPEHRRLDGLADCQTAYRWILENGPNGSTSLKTLFVAGDSAGE